MRTHIPARLTKGLVATGIGFGVAVVGLAAPASADQVDEWTEGVTSGSTSYETVAQAVCTHAAGDISVRQVSSSPTAVGRYRIRNVNSGATALFGAVSDGGVAALGGIIAGTHELQTRRDVPKDTNGSWVPGSGVTTFSGRYRCPS